jgi:hypothetical protein
MEKLKNVNYRLVALALVGPALMAGGIAGAVDPVDFAALGTSAGATITAAAGGGAIALGIGIGVRVAFRWARSLIH